MTAATQQPADVQLIESEHEFFAKSGPLPTSFDDLRRFPRFYHRARIAVRIHPIRPEQGAPGNCEMLTRDLSRGGMSLLHREQLFPGQLIDLALADKVPRRLEVQWCRRLAPNCYALGCRFIPCEPPSAQS